MRRAVLGFVVAASYQRKCACTLAIVQAVVTGTAVSGVLVSLLRVVTKAALPNTPAGLRASAGQLPALFKFARLASIAQGSLHLLPASAS